MIASSEQDQPLLTPALSENLIGCVMSLTTATPGRQHYTQTTREAPMSKGVAVATGCFSSYILCHQSNIFISHLPGAHILAYRLSWNNATGESEVYCAAKTRHSPPTDLHS